LDSNVDKANNETKQRLTQDKKKNNKGPIADTFVHFTHLLTY